MHPAISEKRNELAAVCRRYRVCRLDVFGSAARGTDFGRASDADFLVEFAPDAEPGLAGFLDMKDELEEVLGRPVDLVERTAIEQSRNYIRRRRILGEAEAIYVA